MISGQSCCIGMEGVQTQGNHIDHFMTSLNYSKTEVIQISRNHSHCNKRIDALGKQITVIEEAKCLGTGGYMVG